MATPKKDTTALSPGGGSFGGAGATVEFEASKKADAENVSSQKTQPSHEPKQQKWWVKALGWWVGDYRKHKKGQMPKTFAWAESDRNAYTGWGLFANWVTSGSLAYGFAKHEAHIREPKVFKPPPLDGFFKWCVGLKNGVAEKIEPFFKKVLPNNPIRPFPGGSEAKAMSKMSAAAMIGVFLLSIGGTICFMMSYPIEKHKAKRAPKRDEWWDKVRGHVPDEKEKAERQKAYEYLNSDKSKEGFWKLLGARYLSVIVLIGAVIGLSVFDPTRGKLNRATGELERIGFKNTPGSIPTRMGLDWLGEGVKKVAELVSSGMQKLGVLKKTPQFLDKTTPQGRFVKGFLGIAALEAFGTLWTATTAWIKVKWREITGSVWKGGAKKHAPHQGASLSNTSDTAADRIEDKARGEATALAGEATYRDTVKPRAKPQPAGIDAALARKDQPSAASPGMAV